MKFFKPLQVRWAGPVEDISGIAQVNRNVIFAMRKMGIHVRCEPAIPMWSHLKAGLAPDQFLALEEAKQAPLSQGQFVSVWSFPPHYLFKTEQAARANISYSLFESNKVPLNWLPKLNNPGMHEVWVPCKFQVEAYRRGGVVPSKVKYQPMGVNVEEYCPEGPKLQVAEEGVFKFLTVMDVSYRKYPELLLQAYFEEFQNQEDVMLVFKGYTGGADEGSRNYIRDLIKNAKTKASSKAKVMLLPGFLKESEFPRLHRACDVYINSSRGEGWSLPVLQSMACGVPVIVPRSSSHLDFCTDENSFFVEVKEHEITDQKFLIDDPRFMTHSWWEPQLDSLKQQMRLAYTNRALLKQKGQQAHQDVQKFSWEHSVRKMCGSLAKFANQVEMAV